MAKGVEQLKNLIGPVYGIQNKHNFNEIERPVESVKDLQGPVFKVSRNHGFDIVMDKPVEQSDLVGPVYQTGESSHHFAEIPALAAKVKSLAVLF